MEPESKILKLTQMSRVFFGSKKHKHNKLTKLDLDFERRSIHFSQTCFGY